MQSYVTEAEQRLREYFYPLTDNFPPEELENLRRDLAKKGRQDWIDWMQIHHDEILDFLREMPQNLRKGLDYRKHGRLYLAVALYVRRGAFFLEYLSVAAPELTEQRQSLLLAQCADLFDLYEQSDKPPLWPLGSPNPFAE